MEQDDKRLKTTIYQHFRATARPPAVAQLARQLDLSPDEVKAGLARLFTSRVLVLEADGVTIRMAPPFSAVPTQHRVTVEGRDYFANCAWDALAIPAALKARGTVYSRCERSGEPLRLDVHLDVPPPSDWLFHCPVPAEHWWKNIVFT